MLTLELGLIEEAGEAAQKLFHDVAKQHRIQSSTGDEVSRPVFQLRFFNVVEVEQHRYPDLSCDGFFAISRGI